MSKFSRKISATFRAFCNQTSLHGWHYIGQKNASIFQRIFWIVILLLSILTTILFLYNSTLDFLHATITTSIDTMTAPLSEIFFPSVAVCNLNQVRLSFFEELGVYENETMKKALYDHYIKVQF